MKIEAATERRSPQERPPLTGIQTTWNLNHLYPGDPLSGHDDPRIKADLAAATEAVAGFVERWSGNTAYTEDPEIGAVALQDYEQLWRFHGTTGNAWAYFKMSEDIDQADPRIKGGKTRADEVGRSNWNEVMFFANNIARMSDEEKERFRGDPILADFSHWLERQWVDAPYLLTDEEEKILVKMSRTSYGRWVDMLEEFLAAEQRDVRGVDGKVESKTLPELDALCDHPEKGIRDGAAAAINDIMADNAGVGEKVLNAVLEVKKVEDELRNYSRPDEARHMGDDIETEAVDAMLEAVEGRFDISQRFYRLKAQLLGQTEIAYHERNLPYGEVRKKYSFEEGAEIVHEVLWDLDPDFANIFAGYLQNGQIDVYPKPNKVGGAYNWGVRPLTPGYILHNWNGGLEDVLTLAHEIGHGIHGVYNKHRQNALNQGNSTATAEVASTFMEGFVFDKMLEGATDEERLSLMMQKLDSDVASIFRQVACYRLEQDLHAGFREKGHLSKDDIGALFRRNMENYMGPAVEQTPGSENWWVKWSHIMNYFYVYSYASGELISKSLQASVKEDPDVIAKVKEFFAAGVAESPRNIFLNLGIDIADPTFWEKGLGEIDAMLTDTEVLAKKLGKIPESSSTLQFPQSQVLL